MEGQFWTDERVLQLIGEIRKYPCLWNPRDKDKKNKNKAKDVYRTLGLTFGLSSQEIKNKFKNLLQSYRACRRRVNTFAEAGAGMNGVYTPPWFAYEALNEFMENIYTPLGPTFSLTHITDNRDECSTSNVNEHSGASHSTNVSEENERETTFENFIEDEAIDDELQSDVDSDVDVQFWTDERVLELISEIRNYPCLWDPKDKHKKNLIKRTNVYKALGKQFDFPPKKVKHKFENILRCYRTYRRKMMSGIESYAGKNKPPWYAPLNAFMEECYTPYGVTNVRKATETRNECTSSEHSDATHSKNMSDENEHKMFENFIEDDMLENDLQSDDDFDTDGQFWTDEKVLDLIEEIRKLPCLWNSKDKDKKNRTKTKEAYRTLGGMFGLPSENIKNKFKNVLQCYRACRRRIKALQGVNDEYKPPWFAYEPLNAFMENIYTPLGPTYTIRKIPEVNYDYSTNNINEHSNNNMSFTASLLEDNENKSLDVYVTDEVIEDELRDSDEVTGNDLHSSTDEVTENDIRAADEITGKDLHDSENERGEETGYFSPVLKKPKIETFTETFSGIVEDPFSINSSGVSQEDGNVSDVLSRLETVANVLDRVKTALATDRLRTISDAVGKLEFTPSADRSETYPSLEVLEEILSSDRLDAISTSLGRLEIMLSSDRLAFISAAISTLENRLSADRLNSISSLGRTELTTAVADITSKSTEFDIFGTSVAAQLNSMSFVDAVELQLQLQQLITQYRLRIYRKH